MKKLLIALTALLFGGFIYLLCRSETLFMFVWIEHLGLEKFFGLIRNITLLLALPDWFIYSLPNALWLFSGLIFFDFIWGSNFSISKMFWCSIFLMISLGAEVSQALRLLPGTFDWQDMILMISAIFFAFLLVAPSNRKERRQPI